MDTQVDTKTKSIKHAERLWRKRVKDRERNFKKATPAGKRVLIAKDVIEQLDANKIQPKTGNWWFNPPGAAGAVSGEVGADGVWRQIDDFDREFQDVILDEGEGYVCSACAVGAMFYCTILRNDNLKRGDVRWGWEGMQSHLGEFFSLTQLTLIEQAFELGYGGSRKDYLTSEQLSAAISFAAPYEGNSRMRMRAIMENIIKHKGEFKPDQP